MVYYVSTNGNDSAPGTKDEPFRTINQAAEIAVAGDTVRVYGGTYREWSTRSIAVRKTPVSLMKR